MQRLLSLCMMVMWVCYIMFDAYSFSLIQTDITHSSAPLMPQINSDAISDTDKQSPSETGAMTLATTIETQTTTTNTFLLEDARILADAYAKTHDPVIGKNLVLKLVDLYQFDRALDYVQQMRKAGTDTIEPETYLYILINSSLISPTKADSISVVRDMVATYVSQGKLDTNQQLFYESLIKLWNNDFYGAKILLDKITSDKYTNIIENMRDVYAKATTMQDMPLYYGTALFSLQLLKNGYFSIASKLALEVLAKDPNYTLPYQILAYKHFITQSREPALQYLLQLRDLDPGKEDMYVFMIGVSSYWLGKYEQAALYLTQVQDPTYSLDAQRYLLLSYIAMDNTDDAINTWQKMLADPTFGKEDFYNYFSQAFYKPFAEKKLYTTYNDNTSLGFLMIKTCFDRLGKTDSDVCTYGNA